MKEPEKSVIRKIVNGEEFVPSHLFLAKVRELVLSDIEKMKKSKNFIARSPRIGLRGNYILQ